MATILIVDDDPGTRVLMNAILGETMGHELLFAPDGESGIERFRAADPDLIITDLVMPALHGIRLIEHLKEVYPDPKIIAISGKAKEQLERAEEAGALASITKPIQKDELVSAVEQALSGPEPWKWAR